jgi:hypothetical protein
MNVNFFQEDNGKMATYMHSKPVKKYGFFKFLFDCFMVVITAGFWLIWIFIREMRKR